MCFLDICNLRFSSLIKGFYGLGCGCGRELYGWTGGWIPLYEWTI